LVNHTHNFNLLKLAMCHLLCSSGGRMPKAEWRREKKRLRQNLHTKAIRLAKRSGVSITEARNKVVMARLQGA
jgi:hypothetical protein